MHILVGIASSACNYEPISQFSRCRHAGRIAAVDACSVPKHSDPVLLQVLQGDDTAAESRLPGRGHHLHDLRLLHGPFQPDLEDQLKWCSEPGRVGVLLAGISLVLRGSKGRDGICCLCFRVLKFNVVVALMLSESGIKAILLSCWI